MTLPKFIQVHTLHSYAGALLNRDDSGLAKRMTFGGTPRTRISSQCRKRSLRNKDDAHSIHNIAGTTPALRSRNHIGKKVIQPIRDEHDISEDVLLAVETEFTKGLYGQNAKPGNTSADKRTRQPLLLGLLEVEHLHNLALSICLEFPEDPKGATEAVKSIFNANRDEGKNFRAMLNHVKLPEGLETNLFGRMVTSDTAANNEGAIHVAHSFTIHSEESESDYFSTVDDLKDDEDDAGAAHLGATEITAGLFYGYLVIDVPTLVSNLEAAKREEWLITERDLAAEIVRHLVQLAARITPGAKLGSTAPYARARLVLIEAGDHQPYTLAEAFRKPVSPQFEAAAEAIRDELTNQDEAYGPEGVRRFTSVGTTNFPRADRLNINDLAQWAADAVLTGEVNQ